MSERTRMKMVQSECVACKGAGLVDGWPCGCFGGKRLYPAKAFHTCQGLYFQGKSDGSIEVFLDESGVGLGKFIHITLDKDTWQSMLREIAPGGGAHECERIVSHGDYFDHPESQSDKCSMCHPELGRRETAKPPQLLKEPVRVSSNITPKHDSHLVCGNGHEIDAEHLEAFKRAINAESEPSAPPAAPDREWAATLEPMGKEVAAFADKWEQDNGSASYKPYTFAVHFAAYKLARAESELEQVKAERDRLLITFAHRFGPDRVPSADGNYQVMTGKCLHCGFDRVHPLHPTEAALGEKGSKE